jgi:putative hydrolase of the HAD superfamily
VVILLDLFNTLVPDGDAERAAVSRAMAGDLGVDPDEFAALVVRTWPERITGELGDLPATVRWLADRLGGQPSEAGVARAVARRLELTRNLLRPDTGTLAALDGLRTAGYRLGLVSNCTVEVPAAWGRTPLAGLLDTATFSCSVGAGKPDPRIYLAACAALGVDPADCVYLGDGADRELPAAAALGMRAIQTVEHRNSHPDWTGERIPAVAALAGSLAVRGQAVNGRPG